MSTVVEEKIQRGREADEGQGEQYLTFLLDGEEYGVDILRVQEIKGWEKVTPLPNTCDYIQGVINLRGFVIPIVDLRKRFGRPSVEHSKTTVVVVLKVRAARGERTMGFVVDAVSDVYSVNARQLRPAARFRGSRRDSVRQRAGHRGRQDGDPARRRSTGGQQHPAQRGLKGGKCRDQCRGQCRGNGQG